MASPRIITTTFRKMSLLLCFLIFSETTAQDNLDLQVQLPTVTVRGFLNFRTTVDGTVIVFTSAADADGKAAQPSTIPLQSTHSPLQSNALDSREGSEIQDLAYTQAPGLDTKGLLKPPSGELEQEAQKAKESFRHISDNVVLPSSANAYPHETLADTSPDQGVRGNQGQYPTGLVTVLDGKHVEEGTTTIFETKVIGTYIDGKYAQILQSTSTILFASQTSEPVGSESSEKVLPTSASKSASSSSTFSATVKDISPSEVKNIPEESTHSDISLTIPSIEDSFRSSTFLQSSLRTLDSSSQRSFRPTQSLDSVRTSGLHTSSFRGFRTKQSDEDNTVHKTRNDGTSSRIRSSSPIRYRNHGRQSTSSSVVILNRFKRPLHTPQNTTDAAPHDTTPSPESEEGEESDIESKDPLVSIDPDQVVEELKTITSLHTFAVGRIKSVRTLTITTIVRRTREPSELASKGILGDTMKTAGLDSSGSHPTDVVISGTDGTPSLVVSSTFSTTEQTWRTSLFPVFDGLATSFHTITESLFIQKFITAYKTMPPGDVTLLDGEESNTDSGLTLEPAANIQVVASTSVLPGVTPSASPTQQLLSATTSPSVQVEQAIQPSPHIPAASVGSNPAKLPDPLISFGAALSNNPLAAVYLGLQQLNLQATTYSTITKTSSFLTTDTIYSTKTVRLYDGRSMKTRVLSDPVSTTVRTVITTSTTVQPFINTHVLHQQQQLQSLIATQLPRPFPPPPQYSTITSIYTTVTTATSLSTKIYALTYNAFSTKHRTVVSTSLYPTTITVTSTKEIPLAPTAPIAPYPFPYPA